MSYDIKYTDLDDPKTVKKAIRDIQQFIGKGKRWEKTLMVITGMVASGSAMPQIRFACGFAGIQGYPVTALCKYICETLDCDMPEDKPVPDTITEPANE